MIRKEEFYFDSRDNKSKIHAVRWIPEQENPIGIVQIVHGMAEYVERYQEFAMYLAEKGIVVTGEDHLGHGKSVDKDGKYGYFCKRDAATVLVRDVHRLKKMTQQKFPGIPYIILGHSMGSFILRNYICKYGTGIDGAVIMGTGMQPAPLVVSGKCLAWLQTVLLGGRHTAHFLDHMAFGTYNKQIANPRTDFDWLSRDTWKVDAYIEDPLCGFVFTANGFYTISELVSRIRKKENLARIPKTLPILMVSGTDDPVGAYGKGVQEAYESLADMELSDLQLKMYDGGRHELLNETNREEVMQDLLDWIMETFQKQV